jgi:ribosome recycling factor
MEIKSRSDSEKWSEDKKKNEETTTQTLTDKNIAEIDKLLVAKESEILSI